MDADDGDDDDDDASAIADNSNQQRFRVVARVAVASSSTISRYQFLLYKLSRRKIHTIHVVKISIWSAP